MRDFLTEKKQSDEALKELVSGRSPVDELSQMRTGIETSRGRFFDKAGSLIDQNSLNQNSLVRRTPEISRKTDANLAMKKLNLERTRYQTIFNTLYDQAQNAGMDSQSAMAYARKVADQQTQMEFQGSENEKERQNKLKMNQIANEYGDKGVALTNEYSPDQDYTGAFLRILLGSGTALGTGYYMQNAYNKRLQAQDLRADQATTPNNVYDTGFPSPSSPYSNKSSNYRRNIYG